MNITLPQSTQIRILENTLGSGVQELWKEYKKVESILFGIGPVNQQQKNNNNKITYAFWYHAYQKSQESMRIMVEERRALQRRAPESEKHSIWD